ncbi:MAG: T9SS type A sorting domain-containing protein, partial [candidate division Zixibacteria bacterium]|nr:T9SS type A sorting domain-containing protein [candidate division Zixibacteria bacterium]
RFIVGAEHDQPEDIKLDSNGDVWVIGWTGSEDFPTTPDAFDNTLTGFRDIFLTKFSPEDGSILYSTFLGGDYTDLGYALAINDADELYLAGYTKSTDFPVTEDAYQPEPNAPLYIYKDVFITKLTPAGDSILYSTYYGGYKDDIAENIELDSDGNIIIAGETNAEDFPLVDPIQADAHDIFISKFSSDGQTLMFSTYFGGEDFDRLGGLTLDSDGYVYISGATRSINFPTTPGAFQEEFVGEILGCEIPFGGDYNCDDAFAAKLSTEGEGLIYCTYLGGNDIEEGRNIAIDSEGRVHVVGYTTSPNFPPNGIDTAAEIFVSRFNHDGSVLDYSVTVNSGSSNRGHGIYIDDMDDIYFAGSVNIPSEFYSAKLTTGGEIPDVTVNISSDMMEIPPQSQFRFDVEVTNNESTSQSFMGWTAVQRLPDGQIYEPMIGPEAITLNTGQTQSFNNVPQWVGNVPAGTYRYYARIGEGFPTPFWSEDYWDIEVVAPGIAVISDDNKTITIAENGWGTMESFYGGETQGSLPVESSLLGNYPNPFNATTSISYSLSNAGHVTLSVYDIAGRLVTKLADGYRDAGEHTVSWDASQHASGVYFYKLTSGNVDITKRMTLLK